MNLSKVAGVMALCVVILVCRRCGGAVKIIACTEDPPVIEKILNTMDAKSIALASANQLKEPRAPLQARRFD